MRSTLLLPLFAFLAFPAIAQSPIARTAPRATWSLTSGVTGTLPTQRRENPGAASSVKMYVFGGSNSNANTTTHNALYEFDGTAWTVKTADTTAAGFPHVRARACVAWNFTSNKLVVFGGDNGTGPVGGPVEIAGLLGDTWEWDPTNNTWADVTPVSGSPSPRRFAAMTWDPTSGGMLMFGGDTALSGTAITSSETWRFLGGAWTQLTPTTVPPARRQHSLVTRPELNDIVMVCGVDTVTTPLALRLDVWKWNGTDWVNLPTNSTIPHSVAANQGVYDQLRQRIVLQGGQGLATIDPTNYPLYTGSPSGWCSEWDSFTNEWKLYGAATGTTNDAVIGRISRYFGAYIPALGKVYKISGQNSSGTGTITATCQYQANPVASATSVGTGCTGAAGPMTLTASTLPWSGRALNVTGSGFAAGAVGFAVIGFGTQSTPLSTLHPAGGIGCNLLVTSDVTTLLVPIAGQATYQITVPAGVGLAGLPLNLQMLSIELNLSLNITAITSTNAVSAIVGAL